MYEILILNPFLLYECDALYVDCLKNNTLNEFWRVEEDKRAIPRKFLNLWLPPLTSSRLLLSPQHQTGWI